MRCDCCGQAVHKNDMYAGHDTAMPGYRFCEECYFNISGDLNSIEHEIQERRKQLAKEPEFVIWENVKSFSKQFLPSHTVGLKEVIASSDEIIIIANCKLHHIPIKGKTTQITIDIDKYNTWAKNVNLFNFVHSD